MTQFHVRMQEYNYEKHWLSQSDNQLAVIQLLKTLTDKKYLVNINKCSQIDEQQIAVITNVSTWDMLSFIMSCNQIINEWSHEKDSNLNNQLDTDKKKSDIENLHWYILIIFKFDVLWYDQISVYINRTWKKFIKISI